MVPLSMSLNRPDTDTTRSVEGESVAWKKSPTAVSPAQICALTLAFTAASPSM